MTLEEALCRAHISPVAGDAADPKLALKQWESAFGEQEHNRDEFVWASLRRCATCCIVTTCVCGGVCGQPARHPPLWTFGRDTVPSSGVNTRRAGPSAIASTTQARVSITSGARFFSSTHVSSPKRLTPNETRTQTVAHCSPLAAPA